MEERYEKDWVDVAAKWMMWGGWAIYMIWALAKMFGFINTPIWILSLPYVVAGIVVAGTFITIVKYLQRFDHLEKNVESNTKRISKVETAIIRIEAKL